jgi:hypothetical protein
MMMDDQSACMNLGVFYESNSILLGTFVASTECKLMTNSTDDCFPAVTC